jgi:hypothetical protein
MLAEFVYYAKRDMAVETLARMKADLDRYRLKDGASATYIQKSEDIIVTFYTMIGTANEALKEMNSDKLQAFAKGAESVKIKEAKRLSGEPCKHTEKEAWRAWNIDRTEAWINRNN